MAASFEERGGDDDMKDLKKGISNAIKNTAKKSAIHHANAACPWFTYQPKMSKNLKSLRKF